MISIIVATDLNGGIGKDNKLLFNIKEDLQRFKELTTNHTVIMGRKTQESLPKGFLPNRNNIMLSNNPQSHYICNGNVYCASNIKLLITTYKDYDGEVFIIGGASIYKQFLQYADKVYLTYIEDEKEADSYFNLDELHKFKPIKYEPHETEDGLNYSFINYKRIKQ